MVLIYNHGGAFLKIIIAGAGDIGMELALDYHRRIMKWYSEKDRKRSLKSQIKLMQWLLKIQVNTQPYLMRGQDADVFISATNSELNMMFCLIARICLILRP